MEEETGAVTGVFWWSKVVVRVDLNRMPSFYPVFSSLVGPNMELLLFSKSTFWVLVTVL
jgi:hypothetical protein